MTIGTKPLNFEEHAGGIFMRSLSYAGLLICLLTVLVSYSASQENVTDVVKRSSDAVVLIAISNSSGQETALGSGFLVSAEGEIVTNYHVIKEAHSAIVKLSNGAFFPVKSVLASDANKDSAIVKVDGKNLPFLTLGDIDKLHVGDRVVAIGSPLGLEGTVSDGIVSALRDVDSKKWIQTTAPVSHGNSGGPLLDMNNHVVGVITWGVNVELGQNLNFAAPCTAVTELLVTARQQGKPLDSIASKADGLTGGTIWTSLTSGRDYSIRQDGDFLYMDWISIPTEVKAAGGFSRTELKKSSDGKWRGQNHARIPCSYTAGYGAYAQTITNSCGLEGDAEIDLLSDKRIEGIALRWEKVDCRKCEPRGVEHKTFTLIPK
jgi:V8-like Glu-specific endopeptidase